MDTTPSILALRLCAIRVAYRHLPGARQATSPPRAVAAQPARSFSLDGEWQNLEFHPEANGIAYKVPRLTIVARPGGLEVTSSFAMVSGLFRFDHEIPGGRQYTRILPNGAAFHINVSGANPDSIVIGDTSAGAEFRRLSGARTAAVGSRPVATTPRRDNGALPAARSLAADTEAANVVLRRMAADPQQAWRDWNSLAAQGNAYAQYLLGIAYIGGFNSRGYGYPESAPRAIELWRQAAAQNEPHAIEALPRLEAQWREHLASRNRPSAPSQPAADPTSGMAAEVAAAYRATTDAAIRARIVRNAALYARSRPTLTVVANTGTSCVRPQLVDYRLDAQGENWGVTYRLTNTCVSEQFAEIEAAGLGSWPAVVNTGYFVATWDIHRDPQVGFAPYNRSGQIPGYRLSPGQVHDGSWSHSATAGATAIRVWIGSCPTHSADGTRQIMFRPTAYMHDDPRVACVPAQNGRGF